MSKILIKMPVRPHRQKVLTQDGQEVRLQQFANRQAADALRAAGGDVQGEQFTSSRDALMRDMVANPESHNIKFMGERVPFEGQELEESLSMPDVEGEQAAIDGEFAPAHEEHEELHDAQEEATEGLDESEIDRSKPGAGLFNSEGKLREELPPKKEEFNPDEEAEHMRRIMTSRNAIMRDAWSVLKQLQ